MVQPIEIRIQNRVFGQESIKQLEDALTRLKNTARAQNDVQKLVTAQTRFDTEALRQSNQVLKAKVNLSDDDVRALALQKNRAQDLNKTIKSRMAVEQESIRVQEASTKKGIALSDEQSRVIAANNIKEAAAIKQTEIALKAKRRALMQVSISMFVMNISVGQLLSSILPLVKGNEEATKALKGYQAVIMLSLGPMQAYMALKMIQINLEKQHAAAVMGVVAGMSAAYFWYAALTTKSKELRIVMSALAAVMTVLAARQAIVAITAWQAAVAEATAKSIFGDLSGWVKIGIGLAIAAGVGAAIGALLPSAQTEPGQMRRFTKGGLAEVHEGEIWRPAGAMGAAGADGMGAGQTIIYLPNTYRGTVSQSKFFAKEIDRLISTGQASISIKKVVS